MFPCRDVKKLSQRLLDVFRLSLDEKKDVLITRLLLLLPREPYLPSRGPREPYRHIPAIKIKCNIVNGVFFCKSLYMREPMKGYAYSVNHEMTSMSSNREHKKKRQPKSPLSSCTILKWLNKFALLFRNHMILWDIKF